MSRAVHRVLAAALLAALGACSVAAPPSKGATSASTRTPTTVDEAWADLAGAEAQLDRVVPGGADLRVQAGAPPSQYAPPPPPSASPKTASAEPGTEEERQSPDRDGVALSQDPCSIACTALASMERAAQHVCGLAGEGDTRCSEARTRLEHATERVRSACPACRS